MNAARPIVSPLLTIWLHPRDTIRHIVAADPEQYVVILAGATGLVATLARSGAAEAGPDHNWLAHLIIGGLGAVAGIYLLALILGAVAGKLGYHAAQAELRAALAWSTLPQILASLSSLLVSPALSALEPSSSIAPGAHALFALYDRLIPACFKLWSLVLQIVCVSELLRLDKRRACLLLLAAHILYLPVTIFLHMLHHLAAAATAVWLFRRVYAGWRLTRAQATALPPGAAFATGRSAHRTLPHSNLLVALAGIGVTWTFLTWDQAGRATLWQLLPRAILCGPILGVTVLVGAGHMLLLAGSILGGAVTIARVRAALCWSALFLLPTLLLPPLFVPGALSFSDTAGSVTAVQARPLLYALVLLLFGSALLIIPALARAYRFSWARAAAAVLLAPSLLLLLALSGTLGFFIIALY